MGDTKKIAIVDDEDLLSKALKRNLTLDGYIVDTFSEGRDFLATYQSGQYNAIIMDTDMKYSTGYTICAGLRKQDSVVVIIGMSSDEDYRRRWMDAGANDFVQKPTSSSLLVNLLKQHI